MSEEKKGQVGILSNILCGGVSGLISRFVISPLDVIKIRLQIENTLYCEASKEKPKALPLKYQGILGTTATIFKEEGVSGFWKGNLSAEYLYVAYSASQFFAYRQINDALEASGFIKNDSLRSIVSGASAGAFATTLTYPLDLLRTKFISQDNKNKIYLGIRQSIELVFKRDGIQGLYKGLSPTLIQIMPAMGIVFLGFDSIKKILDNNLHKESHLNPWKDSIAGALAGLVSKTVVFPMDVLRKRFQIQTEPSLISPAHHSKKYYEVKSSWDMLRRMIKYEGALSLYKGLVPGLVKSVPSTAVTFGVYGFCLRCANPVLG